MSLGSESRRLGDDAVLAQIIDDLTIGLVFHDASGGRAVTNATACRILGLEHGADSIQTTTGALADFVGTAGGAMKTSRQEVERDGRIFEVGSRSLRAELGGSVLWRIEDVTEQRHQRSLLTEAKRKAMMADVAGGIGHQFNNLLARFICQAEAIQSAGTLEEAALLSEQIIDTAEAGAKIVGRLMTYAGAVVVDCRALDLASFMDLWLKGLETTLVIEADKPAAAVAADGDLLLASLDEIHANAVQAGARRLRLTCARPTAETIMLEITDDGRGMTAEDCARATDPFFTREAVGSRAGLGLSMALGAIRHCGGDLTIASHPGKGAVVRLTLRLASAETPE